MNLKFARKTKLCCSNQGPFDIEVWFSTRDGTKSPYFIVYKYLGRWITPLEQRVRKWAPLPWPIFLWIFYHDVKLGNFIYDRNPLLKLLPKDDSKGTTYPIPLLDSYLESKKS